MRKTLGYEHRINKKTTYLVINVKTNETKEFLTIREVSEFLGVSVQTIRNRLATQKVVDNIKLERVVKQNEF